MTKITTAVCLLALGAPSILGCSGRSGKQGTSDGTPPVSTDRESAKAAICGMAPTAGGGLRPVVRVFSAMNFKLTAFPELARAVGLDRVADCESAERYLVGYSEFAAANPGFDLEEPLDDLFAVEDDPTAPPTSEATIESQNIYQGP